MLQARKRMLTLAAALAGLRFDPEAFAYCAACQLNALNSPEGQKLAAGFQDGLVFLLAAPFVVSAIVGLLLLRARRQEPAGLHETISACEKHRQVSNRLPT